MAEYKGIKGFKVQTVSTDPAASIAATGVWASGGDLSTAPYWLMGGGMGASTSSALASGGSPNSTSNELYNGTSWTEVNDLNTGGDGIAPAGTAAAGLAIGGRRTPSAYSNLVESWDGTNYTEIAEINTGRAVGASFGTQTSALIAGGDVPPYSTFTEIWNGSSWTEVNDTNNPKGHSVGAGTTTAGIVGGGGSPTAGAESWNGTSWSVVSSLNTGRYGLGSSGNGTQTSMIIFGGDSSGVKANTEFYDGSTWTELADLATARYYLGGAGTSSSALAIGGIAAPAETAATEEWTTTPAPSFQQENLGQVFYNSTSNAFKVTQQSVPIGSWSSGGSLNTARATFMVQSNSGGPSGQTDAIAVSGASPTAVNVGNVELYDGSAWTETTDVNTARRAGGGTGGQPAAVIAGGYIGPPGALNTGATELWNGSTWTETTDLNTARRQFTGSFGTTDSSSDLLVCGSFPPTGATEIWNGSAWTEVNDLNTGRADGASMGTSTLAGLVAGGQSSPSPIPGQTAFAESWNGTSWTEVAEFNTNRMNLGGAGAQTNGFIFGGNLDPGAFAGTELWNGTSWTELNDLALARYGNGGGGSTNAAISFGGADSGDTTVAATEEWNAGAINNTLTAS
jgi:hypothetical protein